MGRITILSDTLCNQIAAGEVVERPAAVVKELIENSVDAGSRKISVSILKGGRKEIRVVDTGSGMSADDALLALERHATSKIKAIEDLQSVRSLGFRGEALPSIAAVSRFELVTREPDALSGTSVQVEGGVVKNVREVGCAAGTSVTVRDLFYNVPARRKFMRSIDTEMAHITDQFLRLAMPRPEIHFQLSHQGRTAYDFARGDDLLERVGQVLGEEFMNLHYSFSTEGTGFKTYGFGAPPQVQKSNTRSIYIFVNGRAVWDRLVTQALMRAHDTLLPKGKFPVIVLFIEMVPEMVDVNVHPTKREVRFRNPREILDHVESTVRSALLDAQPFGKTYEAKAWGVFGSELSGGAFAETKQCQDALQRAFQRSFLPQKFHPGVPPDFSVEAEDPEGVSPEAFPPRDSYARQKSSFADLPVLGQLANTYILLEAPDGLILIDQHAAHERVLYDRLANVAPGEAGRQRLVHSILLQLLPTEAALLRNWMDRLVEVGFEIEPFGGDSFLIGAVPAVLSDFRPDKLIKEMLESYLESEQAPRLDVLAGLAKTASCHSAIRAGQKLHREEVRRLLESLDQTTISTTCPHGRPIWRKITHSEIARLFQRI